jgi:hypothetical protein
VAQDQRRLVNPIRSLEELCKDLPIGRLARGAGNRDLARGLKRIHEQMKVNPIL